ncbi:MAG: galactokinase [Gemmatimonadetes bacterium]|nr:galactokinase [Gemmatimonadota bacterium]
MIITRTPFRVTLGGGGTDLPSYYTEHGGFIFAMGIDKYMYIMVNPPIVDNKIRLHYSRSEIVDHVSQLQHELAREALKYHGIEDKIEISSMADLPDGTGLGSSSSYLVGLLTALHHYRREFVPLQTLAEEACDIEMNILRKGIGKQDQYMAVYGGLTVLEIGWGGEVKVRSVDLPSGSIEAFVANTHLYYTGLRRDATEILRDQHLALQSPQPNGVHDSLHQIKEIGYRILETIEDEDFDAWGALLHEHWCHKKRMSNKISVSKVDHIYEHVRREFGVLGGKIVGAGGGGFVMLYCPKNHKQLERFMTAQGMPRLHYRVDHGGSKVVANLAEAPAMRLQSAFVDP